MSTYLQRELQKVSFPYQQMSWFFYDSKERFELIKKFEALFDNDPLYDNSNDYFLSRDEAVRMALKRTYRAIEILRANKDLLGQHSPLHGEGGLPVQRFTGGACGITDHYALFVSTIISQGTPDQVREWLPKALNLEIIGTYGQTELGHGSNIRALETIATYEEETDTLLVHMPSITAMKWWPGALGLLATHAVLYARLLVKGKDLGFHAIMVQIRDEHHRPMPGVEVGDIGPKLGGNTMDAGYLYLKNVRVPRFNLLAKFQTLEKGGKYTQPPPQLGKIAYMTMMKTRASIVWWAMGSLAKANQIVFRYMLFRKQGFIDGKKGIEGGEKSILDHKIIQHRLFPIVGVQVALLCGTRRLTQLLRNFDAAVKAAGKDIDKIDTSMLPELHATSAGMKAFGTEMVLAGIEEGRKCCGGQGFTYSSGVAKTLLDYLPMVTYEGDRIPMALQTARVLLGALAGKVPKTGSFSYLGRSGWTWLSDTEDVNHNIQVWESIARNAVNKTGRQVYFSSKSKPHDVAWNNNQNRLISMAQAHTLFQLVEAFGQGIKDAPVAAQPAMKRLFLLFSLTKLTELPVVVSFLTAKQGQAIDRTVKKLLQELRSDILGFTEAPSMSDRLLNSYIARDSDDIYQGLFDWSKRSPLNKPEYVESLRQEVLSRTLNREYLAKSAQNQRKLTSITTSKL